MRVKILERGTGAALLCTVCGRDACSGGRVRHLILCARCLRIIRRAEIRRC